jgi:hypothetical protein
VDDELVTDVVAYPERLPVTVTVSFLPAYLDGTVYDDFVAPEIFAPLARHW